MAGVEKGFNLTLNAYMVVRDTLHCCYHRVVQRDI